jgi:hypothetical protein
MSARLSVSQSFIDENKTNNHSQLRKAFAACQINYLISIFFRSLEVRRSILLVLRFYQTKTFGLGLHAVAVH